MEDLSPLLQPVGLRACGTQGCESGQQTMQDGRLLRPDRELLLHQFRRAPRDIEGHEHLDGRGRDGNPRQLRGQDEHQHQ